MNYKMIASTIGKITGLESALLLLPCLVSVIYGEWNTALAFLITAAGGALLAALLLAITRGCDTTIYAREGLVITGFAWLIISAIGAVPFVISGDIPSYVDAFFETASGMTTTGASILRDVEALSKGSLFWRSFTHWIGGMGVLVLMMAILPDSEGRSIHIMRAEMPGPVVDKIVPKIKDTAKILYIIYIVMTLVETVCLLCCGISLFESLLYSFGTTGTGGFGLKSDSLVGYAPSVQWVITIFMLLSGVNYNLYYLIICGKAKSALKSEELHVYFCIVGIAAAVMACNIYGIYDSVGDSIRHGLFQAASIVTTTGYSTADFDLWPGLSKSIIFILLFFGGCAGSTAGGLKMSRVIMMFKAGRREVDRMIHPRSTVAARFEGKPIDNAVRHSVTTYFCVYAMLIVAVFLLISFEPFGVETNLTAAVTCVNNVGPGLAGVGPMSGFADYSAFSKIVLSAAMLLGRLEIYPLLIALTPSTWIKK